MNSSPFPHTSPHHISHGPGSLQIETAGDGVHIEHLPCKIEPRKAATLQCRRIDIRQGNTPTGDKFLLETVLAVHLELLPRE